MKIGPDVRGELGNVLKMWEYEFKLAKWSKDILARLAAVVFQCHFLYGIVEKD